QFFVFALSAPQNAEKVRKAIVEEIDRLLKDGVGADELAKAKLAYKANFDGQLAQDPVVASMLSKSLYLGRPLDFQKQLNEKIAKLTPDDIKRVLDKGYIQSSKLVQVTAGDLKKAAEQKSPRLRDRSRGAVRRPGSLGCPSPQVATAPPAARSGGGPGTRP